MQNSPKIRTQSTFPAVLTIDGVEIDVRVKRMNNTEFDAFDAGFAAAAAPRGPSESVEARAARDVAAADWTRGALNDYLAIVPGQIVHEGREITKGGDLLDIYGGREDVVPQAVALVYGENRLSESQKKTFRSQLASRFGSESELPRTDSGDAPAPTAADVVPSSSALGADVTEPVSAASSGTTVPSGSGPVQSAA